MTQDSSPDPETSLPAESGPPAESPATPPSDAGVGPPADAAATAQAATSEAEPAEPAAAASPAQPTAATLPAEPTATAGVAASGTVAATVAATAAAASRRRRLVAGGVAVVAIAVVIAALLLLGSRSTPEALRYIPADSVVVGELRLDLPGDQLDRVGNLLAHFPGFKDQSTLPQKLDETLDRLVKAASGGKNDYVTQVKPWLAGPLFVGVRAPSTGQATGSKDHAVAIATTDGKVTCDALFKIEGQTPKTEAYKNAQLAESSDGTFACVLDGRFGLLGDPDSVKAAIDAHAAGSGMDASADYQAARTALGSDRLATVFVAGSGVGVLQGAIQSGLPGPAASLGINPLGGLAASALPRWAMAGLRAEDDAIVVDLVAAPSASAAASGAIGAAGKSGAPAGSPLLTAPPPRTSQLATLVPADTLVLAEGHGAGIAVQNLMTRLRGEPSQSGTIGQLDAALKLLGGAEGLLGWIDDAGVLFVPDGASVAGGVVLLAPDDATATAKAGQLRSLLTLASIGGGIDVQDTTVDGTTVTTAKLGDLGALLKAAGANVNVPAGTSVEISIAARGRLVMIGSGEPFARHILDATDRLADQDSYHRAIARSVDHNQAQIYVSLAALMPLATSAIPSDQQSAFQTDIQPYLAPFDALVATTTVDGGLSRTRIVATVK